MTTLNNRLQRLEQRAPAPTAYPAGLTDSERWGLLAELGVFAVIGGAVIVNPHLDPDLAARAGAWLSEVAPTFGYAMAEAE